jgi:cation transport protein ChaC
VSAAKPMDDEGTRTRARLLAGEFAKALRETMPEVHVLTDEERAASLHATLAARPERGDGVWVFAYGSLIWNPAIHTVGRRLGHVPGWRRSFCLQVRMGRGTPENPGLMLGLMPGGGCTGVVLRVAEDALHTELDILWRREMVAAGYIPRWVPVEDEAGAGLGHAIAFTMNPASPGFCGDLPDDETVERLATARGRLGTAAEYLFRTRDGLREMGIHDGFVESTAQKVEARLAAVG